MPRFVHILGYLALLLLCLDAGKLDKLRKSKERAVKVMGDNSDDESKSVEKPIDFKEIAINITKNVGMEMKLMMKAWKDQMGDWKRSMVDIKDNEKEGKEGKEEKGKSSNGKLKEFLELINLSEGIMPDNTRTWICNTLWELRAPDALVVLGNKKELEVMERLTNLINRTNEGIGPEDSGLGDGGPGDEGLEGNGPGDNGPGDNGPRDNGPGDNGPGDNGPGGNGTENTSDRVLSPHRIKERLGSDYTDIIHERFFYNFMVQYCGF